MNTTAMVGTMNGDDPYSYQAQLESFRRSDQARETLVYEILRQYEELKLAYQEKCNDFENEKQARRFWQNECNASKNELAAVRQTMDGSPFVLALIDGDGVIFQDMLLNAGRDGGSDAAHRLQKEIRAHILKQYENAGHWSIMVQIYANLEGLAWKLASVGIIKSPQDLQEFARSFSLNQPLFSFIDVGSGKERADHKIKEMLRLFISNHSCKHIIFGGCHDNGYLPNLDPWKHDSKISSRITLLESTPAQLGFTNLNFNTVRFDSVFRSDPLPEKPTMIPSILPTMMSSTTSPSFSTVSPKQTPVYATANLAPRPALQALAGLKSPTPPVESTWATVGKAGAVDKKNISIAPAKAAPRKYILLNAYDQRLDQPLAKADRVSVDNLHQRIQKQKVCNDFHLTGKCDTAYCPYSHGPKLTAMETLALRHKARGRSCPKWSDCRDIDCYYGHCCPNDDCHYQECYFKDLHNIDKTPKIKMFEDGSLEIIGAA
ncbi:C-x8-C-x5-C-x3-H type zinc finger protein [Lepidopterella palustris CBS 459.81]|uniref:C-x8-C-x5-C-x3-H type zinc finger protein n=1 Tax=Lepidopterella palustris CBS 459.81 TaxID=1314670 RepID=A0A8E2E064_9PEZI|nr:C-x8-C-x5-C-x3-H type zinc finger protein [Lepidopterella palustris CBS 459.81]